MAKVAEARLEQINRYCQVSVPPKQIFHANKWHPTYVNIYLLFFQTLISLDPKLSESAHVVGFFSPRTGDKELPK